MTKLTKIQSDTVKAVKAYVKKHGYHCSQVYLARLLGVSNTTLRERIIRLEQLGYVKRTPDGKVIPTC